MLIADFDLNVGGPTAGPELLCRESSKSERTEPVADTKFDKLSPVAYEEDDDAVIGGDDEDDFEEAEAIKLPKDRNSCDV